MAADDFTKTQNSFLPEKGVAPQTCLGDFVQFFSVAVKMFYMDVIWLDMLNGIDTSSCFRTGGLQKMDKEPLFRIVLPENVVCVSILYQKAGPKPNKFLKSI